MTYSKSKYLVITLDYLLPFGLFLGFVAFVYFLLFSPVFRLTEIKCQRDFEDCTNPHLLAELSKLRGQNLFLLDTSELLKRITQGDYQIRGGVITRALPGSLTLSLDSVYPVLALQIAGQSQFVTLDPNLAPIKFTEQDPHVPLVMLNSPLTLQLGVPLSDPTLSQQLHASLEVVSHFSSVTSFTVRDVDLIFTLRPGLTAVVTMARELGPQLTALKAVLQDATIMDKVHEIDVRFSQPILR